MKHPDFAPIPPLMGRIVISEKPSGVLGLIDIRPFGEDIAPEDILYAWRHEAAWWCIRAGTPYGWIKRDDVYKRHILGCYPLTFARWVAFHGHTLTALGKGQHAGYFLCDGSVAQPLPMFRLLNTRRWIGEPTLPTICSTVRVLYQGPFSQSQIDSAILAVRGRYGSSGILVYHEASDSIYQVDQHDEYAQKLNHVRSITPLTSEQQQRVLAALFKTAPAETEPAF
jgi:hypothetical protein